MSLSLLVCVVGIANAMLMSVTERFREIGTMKCLGALDSFIIKLFLLESTFQGVAGTLVGIVIGLVLTTALAMLDYGHFIFTYFPTASVIESAGAAMLAGRSTVQTTCSDRPGLIVPGQQVMKGVRVPPS